MASRNRAEARRTRPSGSGEKPDWPPIYTDKIMKGLEDKIDHKGGRA